MTLADANNGLGSYPGDPCYDSSRPSWLPYWIDDAQELSCSIASGVASTASSAASGFFSGSSVGGILLLGGAALVLILVLKDLE